MLKLLVIGYIVCLLCFCGVAAFLVVLAANAVDIEDHSPAQEEDY